MKKTWIGVGALALAVVLIGGMLLAGGLWTWRHFGGMATVRNLMDRTWNEVSVQRDLRGPGMMSRAWGSESVAADEQSPCPMGGICGGRSVGGDEQSTCPSGVACGSGPAAANRSGCGMMGAAWGRGPSAKNLPGCATAGRGAAGLCAGASATPGEGPIGNLEQARAAAESYVEKLGDSNLAVTEVMEFEHNYYAIVAEKDTAIGAMELLVDRSTGAVWPEPGPNRMWNAKYGMMGRGGMMGGSSTGEMTLSAEEATRLAQRWLDDNLPGRIAGEADAFYGYYTFHYLKDGRIDGMLSVEGSSGRIWNHTWHGAFVAGSEEE